MTYKEHFLFNLNDDANNMTAYWTDIFGLIQETAINKKIEFDGYFEERGKNPLIPFITSIRITLKMRIE